MVIDEQNVGDVVDLLSSDFRSRSREFWASGIEKLMASPAHAEQKRPVGYTLQADGALVGVGLTAETPDWHPELAETGKRRINLASWYIKPEYRWRLPVLLRKMLKDKAATYTDLSPTPKVQPILESLGFDPLNNGVLVVNLAAAAVQSCSEGTISEELSEYKDPALCRMIKEHESYGCLSFEIADAEKSTPLLLKSSSLKRVPALEVIYCQDADLLRTCLPLLASHLVKRGYLAMVLDVPVGVASHTSWSQFAFPQRRRRYAKNATATNGIDRTYSEMVFFDF